MRRAWVAHYQQRLLEHHATDDSDHARLPVECPRCKDAMVFYTWLSPDPQGRSKLINDDKAASWMRSHPCWLTTATQRKRVA